MTTQTETPKTILELADEVVAALGPEWKAQTPDIEWQRTQGIDLVGPEGTSLFMLCGDRGLCGARVIIYGRSFLPYDYNVQRAEITVATNRGAQIIAREIKRRCLPIYLPSLAEQKGRKAKSDAYERRKLANLETAKIAMNQHAATTRGGDRQTDKAMFDWSPQWDENNANHPAVTVEAYGDDGLNIKLSDLPMDVGLLVLAAIRLEVIEKWPTATERERVK